MSDDKHFGGSSGKEGLAKERKQSAGGSVTPPITEAEGASGSSSAPGSRRGSHTERIQNFVTNLLSKMSIGPSSKPKVLEEPTIEGIAEYIKSDKCKNIIVMAGAGISTAAGIPDFRSPGSGLYDSIEKKWKLKDPQVMFQIGYFRSNPEPFFELANQLFPEELIPTTSHHFVRLLHDKGYLLRHYTQNIDGLERSTGLPGGKLVEAHGSFYTSHCMTCRKEYDFEWMKKAIKSGAVPKCFDCDSTVKPDVVFFGESLPVRFFTSVVADFPKCDLLIIMGTSLVVQPFAYLVNQVSSSTPRLLINRETVGTANEFEFLDLLQKFDTHSDFDAGVGSFFSKGLDFNNDKNRDVFCKGDCDDGCMKLAEALGWKDDLLKLQQETAKKGASSNTV